MARKYSSTAVRTTLQNVGGIDSSATSLVVQATTGWPSTFPFTVRIDPGTADEELVEVTAGSGTVGTPYTITRAVDGTTAKAHAVGAICAHSISARDLSEPQVHMDSTLLHNVVYASTAARDSAIPSPSAGQKAFVTGTGEQYLYNGSAWVGTLPRLLIKPSDTSRSNNNTPSDDPHLLLAMEANSKYLLNGFLRFISTSAAAGDVRVELGTPAGATVLTPGFGAHLDTGSNTPGKVLMINESSTNSVIDLTSTSVFGLSITEALVVVSSTAGNLSVQWAQNSSNATATTLQANSWISLLKVG